MTPTFLRIAFVRSLGSFLLAAACVVAGCGRERPAPSGPYVPAPRAPVIILGLDTVRGDHLHAAGKRDIRTPYIDDLAADGVLFTRCQSTAPWTAPAFASVMTGLTTFRHGYVGGRHLKLDDALTTLAERLQGEGYRTGAFVSIDWLTPEFGMGQGFDRHLYLRTGGRKNGGLITDRGLAWLAEEGDGPAFLFLHYFDAHAPYTPPAPFDGMYYDGDPRGPGEPLIDFLRSDRNHAVDAVNRERMYDWLDGVTDWDYPVRQYAAGVSAVDHEVGRVVQALKAAGLYDQALIIAVGDHGEHLGEHELWFTHAQPWQEVLQVPLVIKLPGGQFAGTVIGRRVSLLDVLPTVCGARGQPKPNDVDGRDLMEVLTAPDAAPPSLLLAGHGSRADDCWQTLVVDEWKLVVRWRDGTRREMLFDLTADPGETRDVAADHPARVAALRDELLRRIDPEQPVTLRPPLGDDHLSPAARRKLRSLGYIH